VKDEDYRPESALPEDDEQQPPPASDGTAADDPSHPPSDPPREPFADDTTAQGWTPADGWQGVETPAPERRLSLRRVLVDALETVLLAVFIFLAVRFSFQNFRVEGVSMAPSLQDGEYLIVNKLAYLKVNLSVFDWLPFVDAGDQPLHYLFGAPKRGDVVVFRSPDRPERDFIKRIIGLPGDTVAIDAATGRVYVNGLPLEEPYARGRTLCTSSLMGCGPWVVPPGHYFVLGDNREQSQDSRSFGFISEGSIIGKALITYWPPEDIGLAPNHSVSFASP